MRILPGGTCRALASTIIAVTVAGGCAVTDPGLRRPSAPVAATVTDVDRADLTFTSHGVQLYGQHWRPHTGAPRGVIVIHHGLADHSDRYAAFAERLVGAGYAVWAYDMRGHGRSAGPRQAIDRIDDLLDDLDAFLAEVRRGEPGAPIALYGHSLGGLTVALYAIERHPDVAGVVLAAPGIAVDGPAIQAAGIRLIAPLAPNAGIFPLPHAGFSPDPKVIAEMDRDPLITQADAPARTARAAIDGISRVWAHPEQLTVPLLAVHGTADIVTAPSGSRDIVARAGGSDHTLKLYNGLHHDVMHDPGGQWVARDVIAWLDAHVGPARDKPDTADAGVAAAMPAEMVGDATAHLSGDRAPLAMAVEIDARGEHADGIGGLTAGLRLRVQTGTSLGYAGGIDVRGGYFDGGGAAGGSGGYYEADAHVLGLGLRSGAATVAVTAGVGIGGFRGNTASHLPVELAIELPAGPTRVLARAGLGWRLGGLRYADDAFGLADEATALLGLRLGRDVGYWSRVRAGTGPFVAATYRNLGGAEVWGVAIGGELWGGN